MLELSQGVDEVSPYLEPLISMFRIPVALFDHQENLKAANEPLYNGMQYSHSRYRQ